MWCSDSHWNNKGMYKDRTRRVLLAAVKAACCYPGHWTLKAGKGAGHPGEVSQDAWALLLVSLGVMLCEHHVGLLMLPAHMLCCVKFWLVVKKAFYPHYFCPCYFCPCF